VRNNFETKMEDGSGLADPEGGQRDSRKPRGGTHHIKIFWQGVRRILFRGRGVRRTGAWGQRVHGFEAIHGGGGGCYQRQAGTRVRKRQKGTVVARHRSSKASAREIVEKLAVWRPQALPGLWRAINSLKGKGGQESRGVG